MRIWTDFSHKHVDLTYDYITIKSIQKWVWASNKHEIYRTMDIDRLRNCRSMGCIVYCCLEFDADCSSYPTVGDTLHHHLAFLVISALPMDQIPIPNLRHLSNTLCQAGQNIFPTWQEIKVLSTHPVSFPNISRLIRTTFKKPENWYALCFWGKPWLALSDGPAFYAPEGSLELILEVLPASVWWESATRHIWLFSDNNKTTEV
jgi:hypothetical protein